MATARKKPAASTPMVVALTELVSNPGDNPRGEIDPKSELEELVASIREHGLLQPILVGPKSEGKRPVIAGHRRRMACQFAGLTKIPVLEATNLEGGALAAAITENVIRQDLSPVAEAKAIARLQAEEGLRQVDAAKRLGKSERWVRERLRLLKLPEKTRAAIDTGAVPLEATVVLQKIADGGPKVADALATAVARNKVKRSALTDPLQLTRAVELLELAVEAPSYIRDLVQVPLLKGDPRLKELRARHTKIPSPYYGSQPPNIELGTADWKAAEKAGCMFAIAGVGYDGRQTARYITDVDVIVERIEKALGRLERAARDRAKAETERRTNGAGPADAEDDKRRAAAEREAEAARRVEARRVNLELGEATAEAFAGGTRDVSPELLRLLCLYVLVEAGPGKLASRGLRYCDERWQTVTENRNGLKVSYAKPGELEQDFVELANVADADELAGHLVRAIVCAHLTNEDAVPPSQHTWFQLPGTYDRSPLASQIQPLIEKVALDAGVLPDSMVDEISDRARARGQQDEEDAAELASVARSWELRVLAELAVHSDTADEQPATAKLLEGRCQTLRRDQLEPWGDRVAARPLYGPGGEFDQALEVLLDTSQIEPQAHVDGHARYVIADPGRSRLDDPEQDPREAFYEQLQACRECGCTDAEACPGGCSWVEADLCSACAPLVAERKGAPA